MKPADAFAEHLRTYVSGFIFCLVVTVIAFCVVMYSDLSMTTTLVIIGLLAGIQIALQSYFFLHIGREEKPRWQTASYAFVAMTVTILVLGSLWIMASLNYNMMHDMHKAEQDIIKDEGIHGKDHEH